MARSERYIPPSDETLRRWKQAEVAKETFDDQRTVLIESALRKQKKAELVEMLSDVAARNVHARWAIERSLDLTKPTDLLAHDLRHVITLATKVDETRLNHNFDVDWEAYEEVKRLMDKLVACGGLTEAMVVAVELMSKSSYQVESSDEGVMVEEIELCLQTILEAVQSKDAAEQASWALEMLSADRVGCICRQQLETLARRGSAD